MSHLSDTAKNVGDAVAGTAGFTGISYTVYTHLTQAFTLINLVLTFLVLVTSLVWGVYRIIDWREKRNKK